MMIATTTAYRKYADSVPAIDGRLIGGMCSEPPLYPVKPPPPFGKLTVASTTVMAPANMSVISARYRPRSRSRSF